MRRLGDIAKDIVKDGAGILHSQAEENLRELFLLLDANDRSCSCKPRGIHFLKAALEHINSYKGQTEKSLSLITELREHYK